MASAFHRDSGGTVTVIVALATTTLIGLVGGAMDYARLVSAQGHIQQAADTGVMAGGNALKLVVSNTASIVGLTTQTIQAEIKDAAKNPVTIQVDVASDKTSVTAMVEQTIQLTFGPFVGMSSQKVSAKAKASVVGKMRLCMLALDPAAKGAFNLEKSAQVTAYDCALYSNSSSPNGMTGKDSSKAIAQTICSAGGFRNDRANFTPNPQTGCPAIKDPLADRSAPSVGDCMTLPTSPGPQGPLGGPALKENRIDFTTPLNPGTYCGGLHITKDAVVTLRPGVYVMKDGPLVVDGKATLTGTDVGFYFTGDKGGLVFDKLTTVSLTAPVSGVMAGLLLMEDRSVSDPVDPSDLVTTPDGGKLPPPPPPLAATKPMRTYRIISDNARTMLGTIYLPSGRLVIDSSRPVADQSAYTVVVAQQISLFEGPNLYLNANYNNTSVPVPKGLGPISGRLLLSQ
ncbi:TadE/TadG family type IV pilus assembly protein [Methylobacterium sp. R2-1]|uniref:TadE/TadG family type IV pilus assembly protein n=1 Tax=Methylobacterium sp. R2-1 TaxID=2587064 RepID=UPI00161B22A6|nr:pilus assembly protein TadG-related protein [Methylobacterium sp. R2-1]MBB2964363.1 Flp pilus assembly protein TadG [Methylobacterium sp. R2-1]